MNEKIKGILTISEIADLLRCSKPHVQNALEGKLLKLPRLAHLPLGRHKVVRREWMNEWIESNKTT